MHGLHEYHLTEDGVSRIEAHQVIMPGWFFKAVIATLIVGCVSFSALVGVVFYWLVWG